MFIHIKSIIFIPILLSQEIYDHHRQHTIFRLLNGKNRFLYSILHSVFTIIPKKLNAIFSQK
ncbi:hypothetical protein PFAG_00758 [Plasmodium falciparum Santa Lucia]|uniref:Uncharacterized protein n=1 Tax=Plasmodium falciparum Santa Lucia TaxID=478859 RepID=W7FPD3_PLAFA|nr:hypothetical protein PFAG_00758 [Plasmodium falciparum Santa Lucia]